MMETLLSHSMSVKESWGERHGAIGAERLG